MAPPAPFWPSVPRILTPEPTHDATADFTPGIRCRIRPGGPDAVLWIHGYTLDAGLWDPIWSLLPRQTHVGIDLPGHGGSPVLDPGTRLADIGERLAGAACARHIRHVVGLSFGSLFALEIGLLRPAAFATLTLAAPVVGGGPTDPAVGLRYRDLSALFRQRGLGPWMTELWMREPPGTFAHAGPALRQCLAATIDRHAWSELADPGSGIGALAREVQEVAALTRSSARLMVVTGEHELPAFRATAHRLLAIRPDAVGAELAGAGHLGLLHAPEAAAALLDRFWDAA